MGLQTQKKTAKRDVEIINRLGLHARPCAKFVKLAATFKCEIWVSKDDENVNGKSIMGLMMLAAGQGSKLTIHAEGGDADEAVEAISKLILTKFDED
jgi:phosphocarrier protein HPr